MQPVDLSTQAQNLGPGTGGLWLGEQQQNAMQESQLGQQKTLEDIATAKQNRDVVAQKTPLELEKMRNENQGASTKLDRDNYTNYSNDVISYAAAGHSPMEIAAYQEQAAKRNKLDPSDERVRMVGGIASQGTTAIAKWKEVMLHMDPKYREEMDKQELANRGSNQNAQIAGLASMYGHDVSANATVEAARLGAESRAQIAALKGAAQAKLATVDQRLVQLTSIINDPGKSPQEKAQANAEAQQLVQAKQAIQTAIVTEKADQLASILQMPQPGAGQFQSPYQGGQPQQPPPGGPPPGQPPVAPPQAPPRPQAPPQAQPQQAGQAPRAGVTQIKDDAGFAALPSGALFVGPDGVTRRKP